MLAFLLRWMSRRSLRSLHAVGAVAGWLTFLLSPSYRRTFRANARQAGLSPAQWRPAIASAGRMVLELPYLWLRPCNESLLQRVTWRGRDVLESAVERARASGRGLVVLTPHLGAFEVIAQAFAEHFQERMPTTVLYRPSRQAWLRELVDVARRRPFLHTVPATLVGVRQMLRALRRGETVGLLPDQVPPEGMGVWASFFGRSAYTMTLAARMARQADAEIVLMRCERQPRGAGYELHVRLLSEPLPAGEPANEAYQVSCAELINREMERLVRECPEQYLWGYQRYKAPRPALVAAEPAVVS